LRYPLCLFIFTHTYKFQHVSLLFIFWCHFVPRIYRQLITTNGSDPNSSISMSQTNSSRRLVFQMVTDSQSLNHPAVKTTVSACSIYSYFKCSLRSIKRLYETICPGDAPIAVPIASDWLIIFNY
jgi:hypothetical protein